MTTVVHVSEPHDVRIDRGTKWGNPFKIGPSGSRAEVIAKYAEWVMHSGLFRQVHELRGLRIACHCKPDHACHGDILARMADRDSSQPFHVIIAGSRPFKDYRLLEKICDALFVHSERTITHVVCGEARGADALGRQWAEHRQIPILSYPVTSEDWQKFGRRAGILRNETMVANADALIAFWDGSSRGTEHCINHAIAKGLQVRVIEY